MNNTRRSFLQIMMATPLAAAVGPAVGMLMTGCATKKDLYVEDGSYIKAELTTDGQIIDTDLLIIGTGYAGLSAALTAAEQGVERIALVDKGSIAKSSISSITMGATLYLNPEDNKEGWLRDIVEESTFMASQDMVGDMLSSSYSRLKKINSLGVSYESAFPGAPRRVPVGSLKYAHMTVNPVWKKKGLFGGRAVTGIMAEKLQSYPNIRYFSKTMITDLLKESGAIAGAIGVNRMDGHAITFKSKAIIIGAGACSFRGRHPMSEADTGDGYALAYNAGATLKNLEFHYFDVNPATYNFEGGLVIGHMGARYLNGQNQDFMWKYDERGSAAPADIASRAMAFEVRQGRGPIYMDKSTLPYQMVGRSVWNSLLPARSWHTLSAKRLKEVGFDDAALEEWIPGSYALLGCVKGDMNCMTNIPGLYAAGNTLSVTLGYTGNFSGCAMWSGEKAARDAARYLKQRRPVTISQVDIEQKMAAAKAPLKRDGRLTPNEVLREIQETLFKARVSLIKNEEVLQQALSKVVAIRNRDLPAMSAKDPHQLIRYHETRNMTLLAELSLRASLERKESRFNHYREDYPDRDDNNWLKWIEIARGPENTPTISYERVPLEKYPIQPKLMER